MWLKAGEIDIPGDLAASLPAGDLVLFVGAGASFGPPSDLPRFKELVESIAARNDRQRPADGAALDQELGQMQDSGVDVHREIKEIIDNPSSEPNKLHEAIVELASVFNKPRIITTNYDRHLSEVMTGALADRCEFDEFPSMAFPQRDDFTGIVYLHGSVREPPDNLVATDVDFAKAYLLAASTASQFLGRVFENSVVLFIGYSHRDTLMGYVARGLPAETKRFALYEVTEEQQWADFGIKPIPYEGYEVLPDALREWAALARRGIGDHEQNIRRIARTTPPLQPEDESDMREALVDIERLRIFSECARGAEWLKWIEQNEDFQAIFDQGASSERVDVLAEWFSRLAVDQRTLNVALQVFDLRGNLFSNCLWSKMLVAVRDTLKSGNPEADRVRLWIPLLVQAAPRDAVTLLGELLEVCDLDTRRPEAVLVFDRLLAPDAQLQPDLGELDEGLEAARKLGFGAPDPVSEKFWVDELRPGLAADWSLAAEVVAIAGRHLRSAHHVAAFNRDGTREWISLSFARDAMDQRPQDVPGDSVDLLVDIACQALASLLVNAPEIAVQFLHSWAASGMPLLRRLAIWGWSERTDTGDDDKVDWLCGTGWVPDLLVRREAMGLLAKALPTASQQAADRIVRHILEWQSDSDTGGGAVQDRAASAMWLPESPEDQDSTVYEYLGWIARHRPGLASAEDALAALQARFPYWEHTDHPDRIHPELEGESDKSRWLSPASPIAPDELLQKARSDPAAAIQLLMSHRTDDYEWHQALGVLHDLVVEHPEDGLSVIDLVIDDDPGNTDDDQWIADTILRAWTDTEATEATYRPILERLPRIWDVGTERWTRGTGILGGQDDWLIHAMNHWAGRAAQIALRLAFHEHQQHETGQGQLSEPLRALMETMIGGTGIAARYAQVVLAGKAAFLFAVDEQWCLSRILPLLDPAADQHRAVRCWSSYLTVGNAHPKMLEAGLMGHYLAMAPIAARWGDHSDNRRCFYLHLASLALFTGTNPIDDGWLDEFTGAADTQSRAQWIQAVSLQLSGLTASAADAQWDSWMHDYWARRLSGEPVPLETVEATCLAEWAAYLGDRFPQAVDLACRRSAPIGDLLAFALAAGNPHRDDRINHIAEHPEESAQLLAFLLSHTDPVPEGEQPAPWIYLSDAIRDLLGTEPEGPLRAEAQRHRMLPQGVLPGR